MKIILIILFITTFAIGTAQAQLASDSPAPPPPANNSVKATRTGPVKLASEANGDTLKVKPNLKQAAPGGKGQKLPSEMEAPKSGVVRKRE